MEHRGPPAAGRQLAGEILAEEAVRLDALCAAASTTLRGVDPQRRHARLHVVLQR